MTDPEWSAPDDEDGLDDVRETARRRLVWLSTVGGLIVAGGVALTVWLLLAYDRASENEDRIDRLETIGEEQTNDLDRIVDAFDQLREQVEDLGAVPVVPPSEDLVSETGASDPDDPEFQEREVQEPEQQDGEVDDPDPFNDPDPDDPDPDDPDPDDRVTVSFSQLVAAVAAFCNANDGCQGPPGEDGPAGANGATSCPPGFHFVQIKIPSESSDAVFLVCVQD